MPPRSPSRKRAMAGDPNQTGVEAMLRQIASKPASPELKREAAITLISSLVAGGQIGSMVAGSLGVGLPTVFSEVSRRVIKRGVEKKIEGLARRRFIRSDREKKVQDEAWRRIESNRQSLEDIMRLPQKERAKYAKLTELILRDLAKNKRRVNPMERAVKTQRSTQLMERRMKKAIIEGSDRLEDMTQFPGWPQRILRTTGQGTRLLFELEDDLSRRMVENAERSLKRLREPSPAPGDR